MRVIFVSLAALALLTPFAAHAHRVGIYAYAKDGTVHSESYFPDGSRCGGCRVEVLDALTGKRLLEGGTDHQGRFSFRLPEAALSIKLVLQTGAGHRAEHVLSEDETSSAPSKNKKKGRSEGVIEASETAAEDKERTGLAEPEIEALLERALEEKLKPMRAELRRLREAAERPGITEVLGGLGYIIGLAGLAAYFRYRKGG
jgi:nickel transport protein